MKTIALIISAAAAVATVGSASAQTARNPAPSAFESVVPFAGSDAVVSGRSAYVGSTETGRAYGDGPNDRLLPHINGVF